MPNLGANNRGGYSVAQFQIECVESNTQDNRSQYSKFVLEPLERGQGMGATTSDRPTDGEV